MVVPTQGRGQGWPVEPGGETTRKSQQREAQLKDEKGGVDESSRRQEDRYESPVDLTEEGRKLVRAKLGRPGKEV